MKNKLLILLVSILLITVLTAETAPVCSASSLPQICGESAVLMNADSGEMLYSKNKDRKLPMASTTKIMTAVIVLESSTLSDIVVVSKDAVGVEGSSVYLKCGEKVTVEDLLYCLLLQSANDSASALAIHCAGDIESFAEMMNSKAAELELKSTHFENPHGLDSENHYTSAEDLAKLTAYALKNETFSKIVSTYKKTVSLANGNTVLVNHNKLLKSYNGCIGVKTGYTKKCGRCLVSSAERNNVRLVCVTLNDPDDWNDHRSLLDYGFSQYRNVKICDEGCFSFDIAITGSSKDTLRIGTDKAISFSVKGTDAPVKTVLETRSLVIAPVKCGDFIGFAVFKCGDKEVWREELYALENCKEKAYNISLMEKMFG